MIDTPPLIESSKPWRNTIYLQNKTEDSIHISAFKMNYLEFYLDENIMNPIFNATTLLENEIKIFSGIHPELTSEIEILNSKVVTFLHKFKPSNIELKITFDKSVFLILEKDNYEIFLEAYIENDNDEIEGVARIYCDNVLVKNTYGKHDFLFKEVNSTYSKKNRNTETKRKYFFSK